jgi:hydrogenase nickel incorporation protein HypB
VQICTGDRCHLDAVLVERALAQLDAAALDLLVIENVGNLVCPTAFDLGEQRRVAVLAVTEGEDKPLKYPALFATADAVLINKSDLADAVGFDRGAAHHNLRTVAPRAPVFEVSARQGQGLTAWMQWLEQPHGLGP